MNKLVLEISNIKGIKSFQGEFSIEKGVHVVCGENGVGKSSIFTILSKIVYKNALNKYLRSDGDETSSISYKYKNVINTWKRNRANTWSIEEDNEQIFFPGSFEASLIYGNRFSNTHKSFIGKVNRLDKTIFEQASDFVKSNLGKILKGDENYYRDLKVLKDQDKLKELGASNNIYAICSESLFVHQYKMSSGEYLITSLLDFIDSRVNSQNNGTRIVLLDEIDLALHPSSQNRLLNFLNDLCETNDICFYISTHSPSIIARIDSKKIFLVDKVAQNTRLINPCYPSYAIRNVSGGVFFDRIILVEDPLAKFYIEKILRERFKSCNAIVKTITLGTYDNVMRYFIQSSKHNIHGEHCKLLPILDLDIKEQVETQFEDNISFVRKCAFLPIDSLEKFIYREIYQEHNDELCDEFENMFLKQKSLNMLIRDIEAKKDIVIKPNSKAIYSELKEFITKTEEVSESEFINHLCELTYTHASAENVNKLIEYLEANI
ncbi:ATP-dependent nuclease [Actinobacillus pleuropneumoniae]|uniref:ATP-dependent nuclease n=1 Tax=Actinobacillus pleuropneumoniae TaxID=715 RepID=UPI003F7C7265